MKKSRAYLFILIGIVVALVVFGIGSKKTVVLELEGQEIEVLTSAFQVKGALKSAGLELADGDQVTPEPNAFIRDGQVIQLDRAIHVVLKVGEEEYELNTIQRTPGEWITAAGIELNENDRIVINGQSAASDQFMGYLPEYQVEIQQAVPITLKTERAQWEISSAAPTLGEALWEAGFMLTEADTLSPPPETPLKEPVTVNLALGRMINIQADGSSVQVYTSAQTVGAALAQTGFSLQGLDYSEPAADQVLPEDGFIRVVRVTEEVVINQETIAYDSELQPDAELEIDQFRVIQAGQVGLKAQRERIRFEDGEEVSRAVEDEWIVREPVTRIQGYGTKIVVRTLETPDGPIEYWRAVEMHATSYSPCRSDGEPGRCYPGTSLGLPVKRGVAAVIYDWFIPMGWHTVYVPGYGHAVIADVGGGIPGEHWIDLGFSDDDYESWSRWVTVYFTLPIPPEHEILYILPMK
jgi:uncharacterized protein YabE (DUF348 family)